MKLMGHLCAHIGKTGPGEPPRNCEMNKMTLPSRHRILNSSPAGLRPSTLPPLGHWGSPQYWVLRVCEEETVLLLSSRRDREPNPELITTLGLPPGHSPGVTRDQTENKRLILKYTHLGLHIHTHAYILVYHVYRHLWWFSIEKTLWPFGCLCKNISWFM